MKNTILVISGIMLLLISISVVVGRKDPVVRHVGYAHWYCWAGVTFAFFPGSGISSILIKDIQLMEEAYKR